MDDKNTQLILNAINNLDQKLTNFEHTTTENFKQVNKRLDILEEDTKHLKQDTKQLQQDTKQLQKDTKHLKYITNQLNIRLTSLEGVASQLNTRLTALENLVTRMETVEGDRIKIALEHASISMEQHEQIIDSLNTSYSKLDNHELRIQILEEKVL